MTSGAPAPDQVCCLPVDGIGEVTEGDDLAAVLAGAARLEDGDILVVTSKVVSKAEGRVRVAAREDVVDAETERVVARRGRTSIVRTRHGLVMAAAGVDASNTAAGTVVLLPQDPDGSARRLREGLARHTGLNVAVLVSDTAGRPWRTGQTDIAVGAAGLEVLHDYAGATDTHGNELAVTAPAIADELAAAADLVKRKVDRRPAAVVRGLAGLVLLPGEHGPGAAALVRDQSEDMFGLGAREAVFGALRGEHPWGFGAPCSPSELVEQLRTLAVSPGASHGSSRETGLGDVHVEGTGARPSVTVRLEGTPHQRGVATATLCAAAFALGWRAEPAPEPTPRAGSGSPVVSEADPVLLRFWALRP
ncbi:MAG TPA: coenzyme F420-0:L-glutamate ligase [Nocardioidaceae bacterium]|nr:coenzyme F420-0:L-glutamate ligase [Nocardioidaceae bacterium]